jgi:hypothetical protein
MVKYGVYVLEGLFSETGLNISEGGKLEEHAEDVLKENKLSVEKHSSGKSLCAWRATQGKSKFSECILHS